MIRHFHRLPVFIPVLLLLVTMSPRLRGAQPIEVVSGQKQLFLDDLVVEKTTGLKKTMHQPKKRGAVLKPNTPADGLLIQTRTAPMWVPDEGVYKIIYLAYGPDDQGRGGSALAISKDGIHWTKPDLGQVSVKRSKHNNRLAIPPRANGNEFMNAVYDPDDPNSLRRYKGLIGAIGRTPVVSPDCIHWTKLDVPAIPSNDESTLTYDRSQHRYLAMLKGGNRYGRAFNISISQDFEHWSKPRFLFGADDQDQPLAREVIRRRLADPGLAKPLFVDPDPAVGWKPPEYYIPTWRAECYNIGVFPYEGLYLGLPMMYYPTGQSQPARNNTDGFDLIPLVMSRDLIHWKRLGRRQAFISPSRIDKGLVGVFDRVQLTPTNRPVKHGDELWFYYSGMKWRVPIYDRKTDGSPRDPNTLSPSERADLADGWGAICLAVLRRDGFVSYDAGQTAGFLLTKPLKLSGRDLYVNLEATNGNARVEILDETGKPIPGYSLSEAVMLTGDEVRQRVVWNESPSLRKLVGRTVRLKFQLRHAQLYAFWTK